MKKTIIKNTVIVTALAIMIVFISGIILIDYTNRTASEDNIIKMTELFKHQYQKAAEITLPESINSEIRVTLIDNSGKVIYDNMEYPDQMGNHINRPEIKSAISDTPKVSIRYSSTLKRKMIYYAVKADANIILRTAMPIASLNNFKASSAVILILTLILAISITFFATKRLTDSVTEPLKSIDKQLKKVSEGQYGKLNRGKYSEINQIIDGVNEISAELATTLMSLESEKDKLYFVLDNIQEGMIALDSNDEIVIINRFARGIFQVTDSLLGKNIKYLTNNIELTANFFYHGEEKSFRLNISDRSYYCRTARLNEQGLMLLLMADVTEEVNIAITKARFFDNASHELKTPITSIKGFVELLGRKDMSPVQSSKYIDIINNNVERLLAIIDDMMALSKMENNSKSINKERIELKPFIEEIVNNTKSTAIINNIEISVEGNSIVYFDRSELNEMLTNLIENAIKYNKPNGNVKIFINDNTLRICDSGIGIENKNLNKIFERFYRVDNGRSRKVGGTGLGLAIVKHIAIRNDIEISVKSTFGVGTEFVLQFSDKSNK